MQDISKWVNNLTYAHLQPEDCQKLGSQTAIQAFKLMQLSIEYMSHTQEYLEDLLLDYEAEYHCIDKAIEKTQRKWEINKKHIEANKDTIFKKKFILKDYEIMFKDIGFLDFELSKVKYPWEIWGIKRDTQKEAKFKSLFQLQKHYEQ